MMWVSRGCQQSFFVCLYAGACAVIKYSAQAKRLLQQRPEGCARLSLYAITVLAFAYHPCRDCLLCGICTTARTMILLSAVVVLCDVCMLCGDSMVVQSRFFPRCIACSALQLQQSSLLCRLMQHLIHPSGGQFGSLHHCTGSSAAAQCSSLYMSMVVKCNVFCVCVCIRASRHWVGRMWMLFRVALGQHV